MTLGELAFNIIFKADTMKLKEFANALGDLNVKSVVTALGFGAVYEGAKAIIEQADNLALSINTFGRETGQSTQEIQQWNEMANEMGISAGTIAGAIGTLEDQIFRMRITGEKSNIWGMLHLDPTKTNDSFQRLDMLRSRLKGMSTEMQRFYLENLNLPVSLLNMFNVTDEHWVKMHKLQTLSNQELQKMQGYHETMAEFSFNLSMIWDHLAVSLVPVVKSLLDIGNSLDNNILKSKTWKNIMEGLSDIGTTIAHPSDTYKLLFNQENPKSVPSWLRWPWQKFQLNGEPLAPGMNPYAFDVVQGNSAPKGMELFRDSQNRPLNVVVRPTINTSDPNTTVHTIVHDAHGKIINNAVNQLPGQ